MGLCWQVRNEHQRHWRSTNQRFKARFAGPAFEGGVTYFDGKVVEKQAETAWGVPLVTVKLRLTNQDGGVLVDAMAEVELPF